MPKLDAKVVPVLAEDRLRALISACGRPDLRDRRDEAIVRLMTETGMRAGEVIAMEITDVDLRAGAATVRRGKGGKGVYEGHRGTPHRRGKPELSASAITGNAPTTPTTTQSSPSHASSAP